MGNYPCVITFTDKSQVQQTIENSEFNTFCNDNAIIYSREFRNYISEIFVNGSMNRSLFYVDIKIKDFIPKRNRDILFCPVFGVKGGTPGVTRKTNYAEILFCRETDISGTDFNDRIFGMNYLSGEETTRLSEAALFETLERPSDAPEYLVRSSNQKLVCCILEKLWEQQENNPQTRFVIKMKNARDRSVGLLQQLYTLLPQQIRLQMGFQTNITTNDLEQIKAYGGIPIYVLTMDSSETIKTDAIDVFPVYVFDTDALNSYSYDSGRLELIQQLMGSIDRESSYTLDYAEKKILEAKGKTVSSFKYYEEIVTRLFDGTFFWWMKDSVESLEEVEKLYMDQSGLMSVDSFRNKAITTFMMRFLPESDISNQIADMILNKDYPNRERLLGFASNELNLRKPIKAAYHLADGMRLEKENALAESDRKWSRQIQLKEDDHKKQIALMKQESERLEDEKEQLKDEKKKLNNRVVELNSVLKEKDDWLREDEKALEESRKTIEKLQREKEGLREPQYYDSEYDIDDGQINKLKKQVSEYKKQARNEKSQKTILMILSIVLLLFCIVFFGLFMSRSGRVKKLSTSVDEMKAAQESLSLEQQQTEEKLHEAEERIQELEAAASANEPEEDVSSTNENEGEKRFEPEAENDTDTDQEPENNNGT